MNQPVFSDAEPSKLRSQTEAAPFGTNLQQIQHIDTFTLFRLDYDSASTSLYASLVLALSFVFLRLLFISGRSFPEAVRRESACMMLTDSYRALEPMPWTERNARPSYSSSYSPRNTAAAEREGRERVSGRRELIARGLRGLTIVVDRD